MNVNLPVIMQDSPRGSVPEREMKWQAPDFAVIDTGLEVTMYLSPPL